MTFSEKVTRTSITSPDLYEPFAVEEVTDVTVGAVVSGVYLIITIPELPFPPGNAHTLLSWPPPPPPLPNPLALEPATPLPPFPPPPDPPDPALVPKVAPPPPPA
jgi:hypothetical protein